MLIEVRDKLSESTAEASWYLSDSGLLDPEPSFTVDFMMKII
jgi:hypothetical protein